LNAVRTKTYFVVAKGQNKICVVSTNYRNK